MKQISRAIATILNDNSSLTALVGNDIYPNVINQGDGEIRKDCLAYTIEDNELCEVPNYRQGSLKLFIFSSSYEKMEDIGEAIRLDTEHLNKTVSITEGTVSIGFMSVIKDTDSYDEENSLHHKEMNIDFIFKSI